MIEKIYQNKHMLVCDNCGAGQEFDCWNEVLDFMSNEGWKKKLVTIKQSVFLDRVWRHYCPECQKR